MPDPATEVIACPACRHVVRVPIDWLGTTVQCPECRATFTAPVRANGRLTEPVLLSTPAPAPAVPAERPSYLIPGMGLLLVGLAALATDGFIIAQFLTGGDGGAGMVRSLVPRLRAAGLVPPAGGDPDADDRAAAELAPKVGRVLPVLPVAAALTAAGGVSLLRRRNPRLAQLGCVASMLNVPGLCCVPGALFGLWGMLVLNGDDGFGQPPGG
jgi:hypothetical protein